MTVVPPSFPVTITVTHCELQFCVPQLPSA
jgi:hypothetical protein